MKKNLSRKIAAAFLAVSAAQAIASAQAITVIYPYENAPLPLVSKNFIFGNVSPSTGTLTINGAPVPVYKTGTFLAYLPLTAGDFTYKLELNDGTTTVTLLRTVKVAQPRQQDTANPAITETRDTAADKYLRPGDLFKASVESVSGSTITFTIDGVKKNITLQNSPAHPETYIGEYLIQPVDKAENAEISFRLEKDGKTVKTVSAGKLTILHDQFWRVRTSTTDITPLDTDAAGYFMFLLPNTAAIADAKVGSSYRLRLNNDEYGWVGQSRLSSIEGPGNQSMINAALNEVITDKAEKNSSFISIPVSETVPYGVEETDGAISFDFYYTAEQLKWVIYDPTDTLVRDIRWKQRNARTTRITVNFKPGEKLWGYDVTRAGGEFRVELRHKPVLAANADKPLSGLRIMLDPGHSPKRTPPLDGAVGPTPYYEFEATLAVAKAAKPALEKLGAEVLLTRYGDEHVELTDRAKIAWRAKGDIFISLHFNALAEGGNPLNNERGFTVYFYQPHSMDLGWAMHSAYVKNIKIPDEGMRYGNYEVLRQTQMPAILIENTYMMLPEQEAMAQDPVFQQKLADTITEGVMSFFGAQYPKPVPVAPAKKTGHAKGKKSRGTVMPKTKASATTGRHKNQNSGKGKKS